MLEDDELDKLDHLFSMLDFNDLAIVEDLLKKHMSSALDEIAIPGEHSCNCH